MSSRRRIRTSSGSGDDEISTSRTVQQKTGWRFYLPPLMVFAAYSLLLFVISRHFPIIEESHRQDLKLPKSMDDVVQLHRLLQQYTNEHYRFLLIFYALSFIFLQTFAIPGSMPLTVLGGTLFQAPVGATLSTLCTGIGASLCYQLSRAFGRSLVSRYLSAQTKWLRGQIERNRCHLFQYIFAMRLTPVFPGWFLNITAPHIGITNPVFFYGTVAGIFPTTLIYSQAGAAIDSWTFGGETSGNVQIFTLGNIAFMLATLFVVVFGRRMKQRLIR